MKALRCSFMHKSLLITCGTKRVQKESCVGWVGGVTHRKHSSFPRITTAREVSTSPRHEGLTCRHKGNSKDDNEHKNRLGVH